MRKDLIKLEKKPGEYFDCTPLHGKWCTFNMEGKDVGFARVGIISSGEGYVLIQYRDKRGLVSKRYITSIDEINMTSRMLRKEKELIVEDWDDSVNPFSLFLDERCDIHLHQTRLFEASPGFFAARIDFVGENIIRIKENSKTFNVKQGMICALMETRYGSKT